MPRFNLGRRLAAPVLVYVLGIGAVTAQGLEPDSSSFAFQDWAVNCTAQPKPADKPAPPLCEMVTSLIDKASQRMLARVAIGRPAAASDLKLVVQVPIGTYLPDAPTVTVSPKLQVKAIYTRCAPALCSAEADAKKDFIDAAKAAEKLTLNFSDGVRTPIVLSVSTKGFAAALAALEKK